MKSLAFFVLLLFSSSNLLAEPLECSSAAIDQAKKLLSFHTDGDDRASVESKTTQLSSIRNPVNKRQDFIVLEVMGYVYKGRYRMRLIYYPMGKDCVLMGQEIVELANL